LHPTWLPVTVRDMTSLSPRPGDLLLDRYLLDATPREREQAHQNLRRFARALLDRDGGGTTRG
jgi:hypothetical protein